MPGIVRGQNHATSRLKGRGRVVEGEVSEVEESRESSGPNVVEEKPPQKERGELTARDLSKLSGANLKELGKSVGVEATSREELIKGILRVGSKS